MEQAEKAAWTDCTILPKEENYFDGRNKRENRLIKLHFDGERWFVLYNGSECKIPNLDVKDYQYLKPEEASPPTPEAVAVAFQEWRHYKGYRVCWINSKKELEWSVEQGDVRGLTTSELFTLFQQSPEYKALK